VSGLATVLSGLASRRPGSSPLQVRTGERRRFATARIELADLRQIHTDQNVTVNDVVLAVVTGALRDWLQLRGEPVLQTASLRAITPRSVDDPNRVVATFVDLPVGEPNPLVRLAQIAFATRIDSAARHAVSADTLVALSGFAPPTLQAVAARVAGGFSNRIFQLAITNVPGPQHPLYADRARLREIYPFMPVASGQALAIGVTSYDGRVHFGLNADYDSMPDLDQLAELVAQSLGELVTANDQSRSGLARRGRLAAVPGGVATRRSRSNPGSGSGSRSKGLAR
jgi:WS/DGAT/MGAT family acyltransferase